MVPKASCVSLDLSLIQKLGVVFFKIFFLFFMVYIYHDLLAVRCPGFCFIVVITVFCFGFIPSCFLSLLRNVTVY